ncbi:MAG: hypothetical protein QNJ46_14965 [Leptolyngbyaceae cyanobacterium MO_188.B28]|nr:hypothetical protein [Leptolyngbyaceae cyanobacterium MO_188.B28]
MFLIDALLNVTLFGGLFYIAATAVMFAMNWTNSRIGVHQTVAETQSPGLMAKRTSASVKSYTRSTVQPGGSLLNPADTELVPA